MANWAEAQYVIDSITDFIEGGGASSLTDNGIYRSMATSNMNGGKGSRSVSITISSLIKPEYLSRINNNNFVAGATSGRFLGERPSFNITFSYNNASHVATATASINDSPDKSATVDISSIFILFFCPSSWAK